MSFAAALSTAPETSQAVEEAATRALRLLDGAPQLALAFFSPHHNDAAEELARRLQEQLGKCCLLGCSGEAVVGNDQEIEGAPAFSLWLGRWPDGVTLTPFHLMLEDTPDGYSLLGWPDALTGADPAHATLLVLADPFTFPTDAFLHQVNEDHRGVRVVGGLASGGRAPGQCQVILGGQVLNSGAAGVLLQGPARIRTIVSQGCRPIGHHLVVTRAHENIIEELGGQAPLARLQQLWKELSPRDRQLFQQGLHVGRVISEYQDRFEHGDFLVRNVIGVDQETGALAITDQVRIGQTVQFHVRDAETADEDLHALLRKDAGAHPNRPGGALLFTCNGRGTRLFSQPHHDARAIRKEAGALPLAGFFAQGELGPIGGQNFIHGFTASVVLFE
jgi:small ligand-binding sensory domain FIST